MTVIILQPLMLIHSLRKVPLSSAFGERVRDDTHRDDTRRKKYSCRKCSNQKLQLSRDRKRYSCHLEDRQAVAKIHT